MKIFVKSKKDRDALSHVVDNVYSLGVSHGELDSAIEDIPRDDFVLILLGREDARWLKEKHDSSTLKVHVFWKARIRNGRLRELRYFVEEAKFRFITDVVYNGVYFLGEKGMIKPIPGSDLYFLPYDWPLNKVYSSLLGVRGSYLVVRRKGIDIVYGKGKVVGIIDREKLDVKRKGGEGDDYDLGKLLEANVKYLKEKVDVTIKKMEWLNEKEVVVPFSGGKDSTTVYFLLKEMGIEFTPIFVDTGAEHEETYRYVERLGAEVVEAPIREKFKRLGYEYLLKRNCTVDKIKALYSFIRKNFEDPIIVNGDRISESIKRSNRPEVRRDEFLIFSPIKYWSFLDEQLYLHSRSIPLNSLYLYGFYRIGCRFCPFTDKFEENLSIVGGNGASVG